MPKVEAPGHPGHPPPLSDAVVNWCFPNKNLSVVYDFVILLFFVSKVKAVSIFLKQGGFHYGFCHFLGI